MITDQTDAFERLLEIQNELNDLASEAAGLVQEFFPSHFDHADAYGVFNVTESPNPYDITFESMIRDITDDEEN